MFERIGSYHSKTTAMPEYGGAALEYVIVTIFGLVLSLAAISFVSDSMKTKFDRLSKATGVDFDMSSLNLFNSDE